VIITRADNGTESFNASEIIRAGEEGRELLYPAAKTTSWH
jgi:hypothetical protein